jgi:hypothetical protein
MFDKKKKTPGVAVAGTPGYMTKETKQRQKIKK